MNSKRDVGEWERRFHDRIIDQLNNTMNRSMKRNLCLWIPRLSKTFTNASN